MGRVSVLLIVCLGITARVSAETDETDSDEATTKAWTNNWFPGSPGTDDNNPTIEYENNAPNEQTDNDATTKSWPGSWFPGPPGKPDKNPAINYSNTEKDKAMKALHDDHHGVQMGVPSKFCDDAKTNLTMDWDGNPRNYTCYDDKKDYLPNEETEATLTCETIPDNYNAVHYCMQGPIAYNKPIPTFGGHRPLWPKYGEYRFVPIQRWLHSLEHGAIVMLYHPCANAEEVDVLRQLVTGCLYRHVITPYTLITKERPLVLVAWGCRLEMSKVDPKIVTRFIKKAALRGPEHIRYNGQYSENLVTKAKYVSDKADKILCPNSTDSSEESDD